MGGGGDQCEAAPPSWGFLLCDYWPTNLEDGARGEVTLPLGQCTAHSARQTLQTLALHWSILDIEFGSLVLDRRKPNLWKSKQLHVLIMHLFAQMDHCPFSLKQDFRFERPLFVNSTGELNNETQIRARG